MKKMISTILAAVMVMGLAGTAQASSYKKLSNDDVSVAARLMSPDDLKDNKGTMLVIDCYIVEWGYSLEYSVTYDGLVYTPYNYGMQMSDRDLLCIYNFCVNASDGRYDSYSEDVCDGETYTYTFYDTDGKAHELYSGYCYDNDELMKALGILSYYQCDILYEECWDDGGCK